MFQHLILFFIPGFSFFIFRSLTLVLLNLLRIVRLYRYQKTNKYKNQPCEYHIHTRMMRSRSQRRASNELRMILPQQPTIHIDGKLKAKGLCDTGCDYKLFYGKAISHDILMINLIKLQVYVWQRLYGKLHKNLLFVVRVMDENDTRTGLDTYSC